MIKHELTEWAIDRPGRGWWYKMQLFNSAHHSGPMLYFDLDTIIVGDLDWIWQQPTAYFWAIRDFKYLWRPNHCGLNSSVMWWDTRLYQSVWDDFSQKDLNWIMQTYRGDQDYISAAISENQRRMFDTRRVQSWRWQCLDGGYNFQRRQHATPGTGTQFSDTTSIMVFHGSPKPIDLQDPVILQHWQ
jgi:hypothetical protein